jgi:hypothetical protein
VAKKQDLGPNTLLNRHIAKEEGRVEESAPLDDRSVEEKKEDEQDLYSVDNFTV